MGARTIVSDDDEEYEEGNIRDAFDIEATEEGGDDGEEEGQDDYEKDGFVVDDVEEEVGEGSGEEMKKKKKKKKKREAEGNYELDEDDYELLQEANVTGFHWSKPGTKQFKRLKKAGKKNDREAKTSFFHDIEMEDGGRTTTTAEKKLKCSLFGDDEGMLPEDLVAEEDQLEEGDMEEDEMADFIVDDEEVDVNDLPVRSRRSKKRVAKQARGKSSSDLKEARDTGAVDKILTRRKKGLKVKGLDEGLDHDLSSKRLEDEYEPSVLAEKYMTGKDDQIRETDLPERFQLSEEISGPYPQNEDTLPEANWIYERAFGSLAVPMRKEFQHITKLDKEEVVKEISTVLQMCHDQKLEVPFIAMYRKEMCRNLLQDQEDDYIESTDNDSRAKLRMYKVLWAIDVWDRKWILLQRRKNALKASYEKRAGEEASRDPVKVRLLDSILKSLDDAGSERTVDDIDAKFNLHFPPDEVELEQGQFKRPNQKSMYSICRKSGLGAITKMFGLTTEQLGKNLLHTYKRYEVEDACTTPDDVAAELSGGEFRDPQSVLKGARHMMAVEISCEPAVKEYVRSIYMQQAVLTTRPTADGNNTIDSFHQYAGVKWLCKKPIRMFDNAQWLLIQKAEAEKLLQVTIYLPKDALVETLMPEFEKQYLSHRVNPIAQLWNDQRKLIVKDALCNYILPSMEKEARMILSMRAKSCLVEDYKMQLWKKVSIAPYQHRKYDIKECSEENAGTRVMACCQGSGKDPTTFVMLDASGEVLDILFTSYLNTRSKNPGVLKRRENDWQRLSKLIMDQRPHIVVLGASNIRCKYLKDDMEAMFKMVNDRPDDPAEEPDSLDVVYADEILPRLYETSRISQEQLPTQRGIVRRAVALGRYLQNPLAMVATLCGPGREILSLKLHLLEHFLSTDDRYEGVEQVMITVTSQVGIDINLAASHEWMFAPLQFVAGLGPRKVASMQKAISRAGRVYSRRELLTLGAVKRLVFINAVGFLRVRGTGQAASGSQVMDAFDDTRIHPESYELAKKMVKDVYCEDVGQDIDGMDEAQQEIAIKHVKSHPHLLKALDINDYAKNVEQQSDNKRRETLSDIKFELLHGFQDWRLPYRQPDEDEEFIMLTGENEETLAEGKIVQATVRRVLDQHVICNLESGITGRIVKDDLSDDTCIDQVEKITEGSILTCRVKSVQKARYLVELTCKLSELRSDQFQIRQDRDCYYAEEECIFLSEQEKARKEKEHTKKSFKPRMIAHPQFQNISESDAIKNLSDKDAGESIIRPSSKGPSYLTLTLKVCDRIYAHKDIVEGGKDHRDFAGFLQLGKTLSIGEETFEGLDEVIARYVDPLVSNLKAILAYKKFRRGTNAEIAEALQKEKDESPATIPYCISVSHEHPGAFVLTYVKSNTHHEHFGLYPKGFKFRKRMFDNLDSLVAYFQKHINDLVQDSIPPSRSVAAMVPKKNPGLGQSSGGGGSFGSIWGGSATNSGGGGDVGRQSHTGIDCERSSTPGSRKGGSSFNRPPNGRGRGRRGGGGRGGSWNEGRGGGGRGGSWNEGRGGGGRGASWNEGRGGGGSGGGDASWNEGRGGGGSWNEGRGSGGRVSDNMDGSWGQGSGGGVKDGGWGGGGSSGIADGGWNEEKGNGGRVGDSKDSGWGQGSGGGIKDGGWGGGGSSGIADGGWNEEKGNSGRVSDSKDSGLGQGSGGGSSGIADGGWNEEKGNSSRVSDSKDSGWGGGDGGIADGGWGGGGSGSGGNIDSGWDAGVRDGEITDGGQGGGKGGGSEQAGGAIGGGGGSGEGGRNEGRVVGFGWTKNEGRDGGNIGRRSGSMDGGWGGGGGGSMDSGWGGGGGGNGGGSTDGGWGGGGGGGGSTDGGWGGGGGSTDGFLQGGGGCGVSTNSSWGGGGGGGGSTDGGWGGGGSGGGGTDGGWGGGGGSGITDGGCGGGGGGKSMGGGWGGGGGGGGSGSGNRDGGWVGGRGGGWGGGRGSGGSRGRGGRGGGSTDGGWGRGGGGNGEGGRSEGRGGGFGRTRNEGTAGSNRGRWSEDRGNRWGRNTGRGRGRSSGRGGLESNFNSRQRQSSGSNTNYSSFSHKQERDVWGSKADEWGSDSGNRNSKPLARADWISDSQENGKNKQDNWWDAGKRSEGWNSLTVSDRDATPKDKTSGWDTANKTGGDEISGAEAGMPGDVWGGTEAAKTNDAWGVTEAPKSNIGWGGSGTDGKNDEWAMDGVGTENGACGSAKDSDGWGHPMAGGSVNAGGNGWGS